MNFPTELWYQVFSFLDEKNIVKLSCNINIHNLKRTEIILLWKLEHSVWFDCVSMGSLKVLKLLFDSPTENIDINTTMYEQYYNNNLLYWTCVKNQTEIVKFLVNTFIDIIDINEKYHSNFPLLPLAVHNNNIELVEFLINNGADVNICSIYNCSSLYLAIKREKIDLVKLLLLYEANPNIENIEGNVPLHRACELNNYELSQLLILYGANVNHANNFGETPLFNTHDTKIKELLIKAGANKNHKNKVGKTIFDIRNSRKINKEPYFLID